MEKTTEDRTASGKMLVVYVPVSALRPAEYNPRKWDEAAVKQLRQSIENFGLVDPIIVNAAVNRNGIVIGGHFRLEVAKSMGFSEVPVVYVDIPDEERERELNLRLNKNLGDWDWSLLANFNETELLGVGFSDEELAMGFGLSDAELESVEPDRLQALQIDPPESVRLKERAIIRFDSKQDYDRVKSAVMEKHITADSLISLL
jgi:ParB-like chromosome segregation protein Spo0J